MENLMSLSTHAASTPERTNFYTRDQEAAKSTKNPIDQAPAGMLKLPMDQGIKQLEEMLNALLATVGGGKEDPMGLPAQEQTASAPPTSQSDPLGDSCGDVAPEGQDAPSECAQTKGGAPAQGGMGADDTEARGKAKDLKCESALQRNIDKLPKKMKSEDIDKLINAKDTPPDLKEALEHLKSPEGKKLRERLDTAGKGGDVDGCISKKDFKASAANPELRKYNEDKSKEYVKNYIPSDAPKGDTKPREMTGSDAAREMYKYSDKLPKHVDTSTLKDIVSGRVGAPPQMMAAAQYYLDHPKEFKSNNRDYLQDDLSKKIRLTDKEKTTVDNLDKDKGEFFKDGQKPNREKLQEMAGNEKLSPRIRETAKELLNNPTLFGMIENAGKGHGTNLTKKNNDGKMSAEDVSKFRKDLSPANTAEAPPPVYAPKTQFSAEIGQEMADGVANQPGAKKSEGGEIDKFGKGVLKVGSKVLDAVQIAADITASIATKIPGVNMVVAPIAAGVSVAANGLNNLGLKPYIAHIEDGTSMKDGMKKGAVNFGIGLASTAISVVTAPGVGGAATAALGTGAKEAVKAGAKVGATEVAEAGAKVGATEAAEVAARGAAAEGTEVVVREGAEAGAGEGAEIAAREGAEAGATEGAEAGAGEGAEAAAREGAESGATVTTEKGADKYASWLAQEQTKSTTARESAEGAGATGAAAAVKEPVDLTTRAGQEAYAKGLAADTGKKMASGAATDAGTGYVTDSGVFAGVFGKEPEPTTPEVPVIAEEPPTATPAA
jgi:type III secretion translocon protein HrpF